MKNRQGFTLVELLAVIAILAVLVIIALPNIVSLFNEAKKNSFINELKTIVQVAQNQWITDSMFNTNEKEYSRCKNNACPDNLELNGRKEIDYYIKLDKSGKIINFSATDGTYQYNYEGPGLDIEKINSVEQVAQINSDDVLAISGEGVSYPNDTSTYVYAILKVLSSTNFTIGESIPSGANTKTSIPQSDCFLRLKMKNNLIINIDIGFMLNENYYYLIGKGELSANANIATLKSVFGEENCDSTSSSLLRCTQGSTTAFIRNDYSLKYNYSDGTTIASIDVDGNGRLGSLLAP
jgi:prepilin-type N-terminal cleavage/methylation domain-containing protein